MITSKSGFLANRKMSAKVAVQRTIDLLPDEPNSGMIVCEDVSTDHSGLSCSNDKQSLMDEQHGSEHP